MLFSIDKAIMTNPEYPEAFNNRGLALHDLGRRDDALRSYDRALALKPEFPDALKNRGNVLRGLKRFEEALKSYDKAIALVADAGAYHGRSFAYMRLNRFDDALMDIEKAIELNPDLPYALGQFLVVNTQLCHWQGLEDIRKKVVSAVRRGALACAPSRFLASPAHPRSGPVCGASMVADRYPSAGLHLQVKAPDRVVRRAIEFAWPTVRDFRSHATVASLIAGVFEHHDKLDFELHGVSFGPGARRAPFATVWKELSSTSLTSTGRVTLKSRSSCANVKSTSPWT